MTKEHERHRERDIYTRCTTGSHYLGPHGEHLDTIKEASAFERLRKGEYVTYRFLITVLLAVGGGTIIASYNSGSWKFDVWRRAHGQEHRLEEQRQEEEHQDLRRVQRYLEKTEADVSDIKDALREMARAQHNERAAAKLKPRPLPPAARDGGTPDSGQQ